MSNALMDSIEREATARVRRGRRAQVSMMRVFCAHAAFAVAVVMSTIAQAAAPQRTFVASSGSDANACSLSAPCRGFAAAITAVAAGGEVIVLDSAGYGSVTITKSVSITAPSGVYAGITAFSGDGITVQGSNIRVILRGVAINGMGGQEGVRIWQAGFVRLERVSISGFTQNGIVAYMSSPLRLEVVDTVVAGNTLNGLYFSGPVKATLSNVMITRSGNAAAWFSDGVVATLSHVTVSNNEFGITAHYATGMSQTQLKIEESSITENDGPGIQIIVQSAGAGVVAAVDRSQVSSNTGIGFFTSSEGQLAAYVTRSSLHNNQSGVVSLGNSQVYVSDSVVTSNAQHGLAAFNSSTIFTRGNNTVNGNTQDSEGTIVSIGPL